MSRSPKAHGCYRLVASLMIGAAGCSTVPAGAPVIVRAPRMSQALAAKAHASKTQSLEQQSIADAQGHVLDQPKTQNSTAVGSITLVNETQGVVENAPPQGDGIRTAVEEASVPPPAQAVDATTEPALPLARYTFSLANVLSLANDQNPNVALARERIQESYARVDRAETLWLPSLRAGLNYNHHEGTIQDVAGNVFPTNRSAFYGGLGANAVGASSPAVPGLLAQFHVTDAIFQPKIAAHQAASREFGATAARNDVLRDTAVAYLELVRAEQGLAVAQEALDNTKKLANLTRQYAETGQGLQSDHQRMEAEVAVRQDQLAGQVEAVQTASARLAQLLHADPSQLIASGEPLVAPLDVLTLDNSAAEFVSTGLSRRPELAEQKQLVCEATERLRREKYAPLVPSVLLGMSYGGMGGGLGNSITNTGSRWDADAVASWEIRNMGFGERAARNETSSLVRQTQMRELALLDRVAREVTESHARVVQRKKRIDVSKQGIVAAEQSYSLNQQRIENAQGLPIEVLQSIQALATARRNYLTAVVDYNIAQFELCHAIGWFTEA
ncbi:MAG: Outer rane efflux protein [Planctomycetaceae bacterium]|nr:Outer rane efflux protein [Planctomycetaceae bacterium]